MDKLPRLSASVVLLRRRALAAAAALRLQAPAAEAGSEASAVGEASEQEFEVLLAQRSRTMNSFSSMYVFPGGVAEEAADRAVAAAHSGGALPSDESVAKVTGIRELFEEAGVLLCASEGGGARTHLAAAHNLPAREQRQWQQAVHADAGKFQELLRLVERPPALGGLHYFVTFITPLIEKRRFRTNFFVSFLDDSDDAQVVLDDTETVRYTWATPSEALRLNREGKMQMLPPQFYALNTLCRFRRAEDVIASLRKATPPLPILPHAIGLTEDGEQLVLVYPGDQQHPEFTGGAGDLRRIYCRVPLGAGGYQWVDNLPAVPTHANWKGKRPEGKL
jgi:nucleoside diphosphate-linked moiety X motif protein 19